MLKIVLDSTKTDQNPKQTLIEILILCHDVTIHVTHHAKRILNNHRFLRPRFLKLSYLRLHEAEILSPDVTRRCSPR